MPRFHRYMVTVTAVKSRGGTMMEKATVVVFANAHLSSPLHDDGDVG